MEFKYVPVLRGLRSELDAISNQNISNKIVPLIEMIKERESAKSKDDFATYCKKIFARLKSPFFVDIPTYLSFTKKAKPEVASFLSTMYQNTAIRSDYLKSLSLIKPGFLIPVISYNPNLPYINLSLTVQNRILRPLYNKLAFRVFNPLPNQVLDELKLLLQKNDILIFDISDQKHDFKGLQSSYSLISQFKSSYLCNTVILNRALDGNMANTGIVDNQIINSAVTDLINVYNTNYSFDAFGDFAGIKPGSIEEIPVSSPAYIHYCNTINKYIGFKGVFKQIKSFESMVLPKYVQSKCWTTYLSKQHKDSCYGCRLINDMLSHKISPNHAPRWKTLTIAHYIRSIDELI